jgi:hypothetical protein
MRMVAAGGAVCFMLLCTAAVGLGRDESMTVQSFGYGSLQYGQINKGIATVNGKDKELSGLVNDMTMTLGLGIRASLQERTRLVASVEGKIKSYPYDATMVQEWADIAPQHRFFLYQAEATHIFGDIESQPLEVGFGYFPYKYNPKASHLGEYLFRSNTYPQVLYTEFEFPMKQLLGARLSANLFEKKVRQDLLVTLEESQPPYKDLSAAYIAKTTFVPGTEFGAGVQQTHLYSDRPDLVTPRIPNNVRDITVTGTRTVVDTMFNTTRIDTVRDTTFNYSFAGTKLMVEASVDIKEYFPVLKEMLGPEDLCIYGEMAVLGAKNYPGLYNDTNKSFYDDILKRMPVMAGLALPAFKVMDLVAVEVELFRSDYYNNPVQQTHFQWPFPRELLSSENAASFSRNPLKWTIYARKNLDKALYFSGMIGRDHTFLIMADKKRTEEYMSKYGEVVQAANHLLWAIRAGYCF